MSKGYLFKLAANKVEPEKAFSQNSVGIEACIVDYIEKLNQWLSKEKLIVDQEVRFYVVFHGANDLDSSNSGCYFEQSLFLEEEGNDRILVT